MILVLFEHLETLLLGLYFHDNYYMSNVFTEIIGMAPPINVQDWYGDRHTSQIASGALEVIFVKLNLRISNCTGK